MKKVDRNNGIHKKNKDFNTLKEKSKCNLGINLIFIIIAINTDNIADIKHASNKSAVIIKMTENIKKDRMFRAANNLPAKYRRPFAASHHGRYLLLHRTF